MFESDGTVHMLEAASVVVDYIEVESVTHSKARNKGKDVVDREGSVKSVAPVGIRDESVEWAQTMVVFKEVIETQTQTVVAAIKESARESIREIITAVSSSPLL
jgi:hypothetical protein